VSWDEKAYARSRWLAIKADPTKLAAYRARVSARTAARRAEDPEWHERKKAYARDYHQKNQATRTAKIRDWRAKNPGCRSKQHRKDRYRLSADDYARLVAEQAGKCAICEREPGGKGTMGVLHVDHCHESGNTRALLCQKCNTGLGSFKDSPQLLVKAAFYLRRHRTRRHESA